MNIPLGQIYLAQLDAEEEATRKCLEHLTNEALDYKPTEKAVSLKTLSITVSEIPKWIHSIITEGDIDLATYGRLKLASVDDLPKHFTECMSLARKALQSVTDEELMKDFSLKLNGKVLSTESKKNSVDSTIRHLVHHRGQLTVYMRINGIPIPKLYGPSGDDQSW